MTKPLALFDVDGTFIRSSLLIELYRGLVRYGVFPRLAEEEIEPFRMAWIRRQGSYEDYIMAVVKVFYERIAGCRAADVTYVGRIIAEEQREQVYVFTRRLIDDLRQSHTLVAITGSPEDVAAPFVAHWGFARAYSSVLEKIDGRYTGARIQNPAVDKVALVDRALAELDATLEGSVGVGDTESDVGFLERVSRPIAFNPNRNLMLIAEERKWEIAIERKDLIVHLDPAAGCYTFDE